jgi:hypothetical protein
MFPIDELDTLSSPAGVAGLKKKMKKAELLLLGKDDKTIYGKNDIELVHIGSLKFPGQPVALTMHASRWR